MTTISSYVDDNVLASSYKHQSSLLGLEKQEEEDKISELGKNGPVSSFFESPWSFLGRSNTSLKETKLGIISESEKSASDDEDVHFLIRHRGHAIQYFDDVYPEATWKKVDSSGVDSSAEKRPRRRLSIYNAPDSNIASISPTSVVDKSYVRSPQAKSQSLIGETGMTEPGEDSNTGKKKAIMLDDFFKRESNNSESKGVDADPISDQLSFCGKQVSETPRIPRRSISRSSTVQNDALKEMQKSIVQAKLHESFVSYRQRLVQRSQTDNASNLMALQAMLKTPKVLDKRHAVRRPSMPVQRNRALTEGLQMSWSPEGTCKDENHRSIASFDVSKLQRHGSADKSSLKLPLHKQVQEDSSRGHQTPQKVEKNPHKLDKSLKLPNWPHEAESGVLRRRAQMSVCSEDDEANSVHPPENHKSLTSLDLSDLQCDTPTARPLRRRRNKDTCLPGNDVHTEDCQSLESLGLSDLERSATSVQSQVVSGAPRRGGRKKIANGDRGKSSSPEEAHILKNNNAASLPAHATTTSYFFENTEMSWNTRIYLDDTSTESMDQQDVTCKQSVALKGTFGHERIEI